MVGSPMVLPGAAGGETAQQKPGILLDPPAVTPMTPTTTLGRSLSQTEQLAAANKAAPRTPKTYEDLMKEKRLQRAASLLLPLLQRASATTTPTMTQQQQRASPQHSPEKIMPPSHPAPPRKPGLALAPVLTPKVAVPPPGSVFMKAPCSSSTPFAPVPDPEVPDVPPTPASAAVRRAKVEAAAKAAASPAPPARPPVIPKPAAAVPIVTPVAAAAKNEVPLKRKRDPGEGEEPGSTSTVRVEPGVSKVEVQPVVARVVPAVQQRPPPAVPKPAVPKKTSPEAAWDLAKVGHELGVLVTYLNRVGGDGRGEEVSLLNQEEAGEREMEGFAEEMAGHRAWLASHGGSGLAG